MNGQVLIVDDSATLRHQIRRVLESEGTFQRYLEAGNGMEAFKLLLEHKPDLVLCDLVMPSFDGMQFLMLKASRPEVAHIPVIMLTSDADANRKAEILERGAVDYVTKPFHDKELLARVRAHYRLKIVQDQLRDANARLEALAITDALTGLFNRRRFDDTLAEEVKRTLRYDTPLGLVMIDLDHFKLVNDTHGHQVGDEVIRGVAQTIASTIRATDVAARYGGEELAVILPHTGLDGAVTMAERLRQAIGARVYTLGEVSLRGTASLGVTAFLADEPDMTARRLLERADQALYQAKQAGRDRVVAWQPAGESAP